MAQTPYSEKLNVFIAGSNGLWYLTLQGINGSSKLTSLENAPGLSSYNITAIRTSGWASDFQIFGPQGYNVFPVPSRLQEGALLTVGSDSFADASVAASAASSYLFTQFISYANATGSYEFYAPLTFNTMFPKTLFSLIPSGAGGFASAISLSGFEATSSPFFIFEGTKSGSTFSHEIIIGSISSTAVDANSRPSILSLYGSSLSSLQSSSHSSSSTIDVRVLDGLMSSKDKLATLTNDTVHFSSSYALSLPAGKKVTALNATVLQQQAQLQAYRTISRGVLRTGQQLTVTISLTNLWSESALNNITFTDDWYRSTGDFTFLRGNVTLPTTLAVQTNPVTPVYTLNYTGKGTGKLTIPASVIAYTYTLGSSKFVGHTVLNPITLSLGADDAVIYSYAVASGGFGKSVGTNQTLKVLAVNVGTQPASSVVVAGRSISGLNFNTTYTDTVPRSATGLLGTNVTQSYVTTYKDDAGNSLQATTNIFSVVFSHNSMNLGLPSVAVSETSSSFKKGTGTNVTLTFTVTNRGTNNVTFFSSQIVLPRGLPCGVVKGNDTTCSAGVVSLNSSRLAPLGSKSSSFKSTMILNVSSPENFIIAPEAYQGLTAGVATQGITSPVGIPTGASVAKSFSPAQLFGGMISTVNVVASNAGPFSIYNVTFGSSVDLFDSLLSGATPSKTTAAIAQGSNSSLTYSVNASSVIGPQGSSASGIIFVFGGAQFTLSEPGPNVTVYQPLSASITTSPASTTEGKPFVLTISITNPSGVSVSNVLLTLPIPSGVTISQQQGMTLVGKNLTVQASSLGPHSMLNANATAEASSGITVPFNAARLTFTYGGVTVIGTVPSGGIAIGENVITRYVLPIGLVLLVLLAVAYYVRKLSQPNAPASPK
jgi:hypothetical protein